MPKNLVIVESPAKAKTLKKFLGSTYKIEASIGHIRDLPKSELGVSVENDFEPKYINIRGKGEILARLRKEVKNADRVYLATDPDREGEAISWHLLHALNLDTKTASRITFNEITKNAVRKSIKEARGIDMRLVDAQQARRVLDRIVGYKISPLLWKKVKKGLSAGRVQSVALKMICDREDEINAFIPEEYWTLDAVFRHGGKKFTARYQAADNNKAELKTRADVDAVLKRVEGEPFTVQEVKRGTRARKPQPPFNTSTLQQEASRLFGYTASKIMSAAQQLYEGVDIKGEGTVGLITYMRTDSLRVADEAYEQAKMYIAKQFGNDYAAPTKPQYKSRARAQDAHEAIRPTDLFRTPDKVKDSLSTDQFKLYRLIWERFAASQMNPALYDTLSVRLAARAGTPGETVFRAAGSVLTFDGYLAVYKKNEETDKDVNIPELKQGETLAAPEYNAQQHFTQPPPRYSEASLVKTMEELGIGRPSTYAATISNILYRNYVVKDNKVFCPTELGVVITDIMASNFADIVDVDFTANMEDSLDKVETGEVEWKEILRSFYPTLARQIKEAEERIGHIELKAETTDIPCSKCGRMMVVKMGRYGRFLACPGFPECRNTLPLHEDIGVACPVCGAKVQLRKSKNGRVFYCCEKSPDCAFISWNRPTGEKCPKCGGHLVERGKNAAQAVCATSGCGYKKNL
jgi:DNA topoisomerase-1